MVKNGINIKINANVNLDINGMEIIVKYLMSVMEVEFGMKLISNVYVLQVLCGVDMGV